MNPQEPRVALESIEVVEDLTAASRCDEGFVRVSRLRLRNHYRGGSASRVYQCDVVSRRGSDAVVAIAYEIDGHRRVRVLLREAPRPPIYLRCRRRFVHPDPRTYTALLELVAGVVEQSDTPGDAGLAGRAARELFEEAGMSVPDRAFRRIGGEAFASPGTSDEKLYFCAARADLRGARAGRGDGSVMEESGRLLILDLAEAIEACRTGDIPDMKTELGLLRLADHLGYLPQLGRFADELPEPLRRSYTRLGVEG